MSNSEFYYSSPIGQIKIESTLENMVSLHFIGDAVNEPVIENGDTCNALIDHCIMQLNEYFTGKRTVFDLPVHQSGSAFQQRVWDLLYKIPYGHTVSYHTLSKNYGDTKAIRAIASANGRNNLPIIIPCHRVIGSNQSLVGYSGGLWRKRWLLEHEAKHFAGVQSLFD
jgi:methylated-DNA-[protein]-cysteine S-methyltransferase